MARSELKSIAKGNDMLPVKMRESQFQRMIIDNLKSHGAVVLNVHGHGMQAAGWPDIYVAHPFWTGWLEFKVDGGKLREIQKIRIRELILRGVPTIVLFLVLCGKIILIKDHEGNIFDEIQYSDWMSGKPWGYLQRSRGLILAKYELIG